MGDFKKLLVWQKAHALAIHVHRTATKIRPRHLAGLRSQLVRAAISIPANIVEGRRQESERDFARFLRYALNSGFELEYHVLIGRDIAAIASHDAESLLDEVIEVRRMLHGLILKVSPKAASTPQCK